MNIQFSIHDSDPLHSPSRLTQDQWKILSMPGEAVIVERDEDCAVSALVTAIRTVLPDTYLPSQDRNPRYYRLSPQRKDAHWSSSMFSETRRFLSVPSCDHLFRVNRHGDIYAYETPS